MSQFPELSDDLFNSKDWRDSDYAGRVEWLLTMYLSAKEEVQNLLEILEYRE